VSAPRCGPVTQGTPFPTDQFWHETAPHGLETHICWPSQTCHGGFLPVLGPKLEFPFLPILEIMRPSAVQNLASSSILAAPSEFSYLSSCAILILLQTHPIIRSRMSTHPPLPHPPIPTQLNPDKAFPFQCHFHEQLCCCPPLIFNAAEAGSSSSGGASRGFKASQTNSADTARPPSPAQIPAVVLEGFRVPRLAPPARQPALLPRYRPLRALAGRTSSPAVTAPRLRSRFRQNSPLRLRCTTQIVPLYRDCTIITGDGVCGGGGGICGVVLNKALLRLHCPLRCPSGARAT